MQNTLNLAPNKDSTDNLIFLEFIDEAEVLLSRYLNEIQATPDSFKIVSFHPSVKSYLQRYNLSSVDSFHFCPAVSHQRLLVKLEEYTQELRRDCQIEKDSVGVRESYIKNLVLSFRSILAVWLYRVEVIANALEYYKPRTIISLDSEQVRIAPTLSTEPVERYVGDIINQIADEKKVALKRLPIRLAARDDRLSVMERLKSTTWNLFCNLLRYFIKPGRNAIIVPSEGYNIDSVLDDLRKELGKEYEIAFLEHPGRVILKDFLRFIMKKGKRPHRYHFYNPDRKVSFDPDFLEQRSIIRNRIYELIESWTYRGVSPAKWLKLKYKIGLEPKLIDKTYFQAVNLDRFLNQSRPRFVLSQYARGMTAVMGELCRLKQIPSLIIPHGSFTPITDEYSKKDWKENALGVINTPYEYVALQTPLTERFLSDIPVESKPVVTGPLVFGRMKRTDDGIKNLRRQYAPGDEKIILHANTPKTRSGQRFFNYETMDEYIEAISSLIKIIDGTEGVHLIVRYRITDGLGIKELRSILPKSKSYSIAPGGDFIDYLSISDLVVSYSSTAMEEALQNDIPVLLFNKYNRNQRIKGTELSPELTDITPSAVYNVNSEENLSFAIEWILKKHLSNKNLSPNLFDRYKYKPSDTIRLSKFIKEEIRP